MHMVTRGFTNVQDLKNIGKILINFDLVILVLECVPKITSRSNGCTGTTQRDGMGREEGGGFRMGNTCKPVADSF